ncbi:Cationic amino acid transporter 1 [Tetrabaena socialis]|uniref:Cationic amino acid transporter 1 n=1 Tax=Tetrabaena socialis TaxID=47790 RepID=A0A2J8AGB3_9CHLO|nr:Cationic amino acid transporter 1 [Tetrabaena socialis]|eukprot:PNH11561.1 Cationic amino acid transporter 1 [Tetrabaena socialis]
MSGFVSSLKDDARAMRTSEGWGFTPGEYLAMLKKGALKRTLGPLGLTCVGVGLMLGAGIFIAPGTIAIDYTGPAVCIAYLIAAVSAYLSCFCYAEFAVDMPLAGAAYNYMAGSMGEFVAWVVTSNLLFEYILADAAVIRGFAPYFAVLIGKETNFFLYDHVAGGKTYTMDWWAFALTLLITAMLALGATESTTANTIITIIHVVIMVRGCRVELYMGIIGIAVAVIALLTDFAEIANMVSIGTFVVFWFVALALLWRRMHVPAKTTPLRMASQVLHLCAIVGFSLGFILVWTLPEYNTVDGVEGKWKKDQYKWLIAMAVLSLASPVSMCFLCKPNYVPGGYKVPFYPFIPCGSLFVNTFLLGQLDVRSYKRFGWWTLAVALIYFLYGIFAAQNKDDHETLPVLTDADVDPSHPSIKAIEDSPAAAPAAADEDRRGEVYMVKMD